MRYARDVTCPICGTESIRIVIDDGLGADESDYGSMLATAKRIVEKHGGWKCECGYAMALSSELLDDLHAAVTAALTGAK
jgi:hypothetical protein